MMQTDLRTWSAWHNIHQKFEINWWRDALGKGHCNDETHAEQWDPVYAFIKPQGYVLDIGAGPRPPFPPCTVIDPLANEYQKLVPVEWWTDVQVYAQPAEQFIGGLHGCFETIICWNCLDHTIGWREILCNMREYGTEDASYAIATDFHPPFEGHPGYPREKFMTEVYKYFKVTVSREPFGRQLALLMKARE